MGNVPVDSKNGVDPRYLDKADKIWHYAQKNSGILNSHIVEPIPNPSTFGTEVNVVDLAPSNCYIIMGRDRPRGASTGYGGRGNSHAGCIDIIAGMSGRMARAVDKDGKTLYTDKSPELDAARIYISQKADVDEYFNLHAGKVGQSVAKSGIVIKADAVRLVAREGIKLVSSGTDVFNSQGLRTKFVPGIDLIAGNRGAELEPLVLGKRLAAAQKDQNKMLTELSGIVNSLVNAYLSLIAALAAHTHIAAPLIGGPVSPSPDLAAACLTQLNNVALLLTDLMIYQSNITLHNSHFYTPLGKGYISSPYNKTN